MTLDVNHPDTLVNAFADASTAMAAITPPPSIAPQWTVMVKYLTRVHQGFDGVTPTDATAVAQAFQQAVTTEQTDAATAAATAINTYIAGGCTG